MKEFNIVFLKMLFLILLYISLMNTRVYAALNQAPMINGNPATSIYVGEIYNFMPAASDPDNDPLAFKIINKPLWLSFNPKTGALTGTPSKAKTGVSKGIRISVQDGKGGIARLPAFNLRVVRVNHAPIISGDPLNSVKIKTPYFFKPTVVDVDKDKLKFSIIHKPS